MKISFIVKTPDGYQTLAKTSQIDKALDILKRVKADGVLFDLIPQELSSQNAVNLLIR